MAKVILDTSFILTCVRNRLDFFEELFLKGHSVFIPRGVVFASRILESASYREVDCPGKYADSGIKNYLKEHQEFILATVDSKLKKSVKNRKIVIRNKKKLELQ